MIYTNGFKELTTKRVLTEFLLRASVAASES
jgi:hypothetical protein